MDTLQQLAWRRSNAIADRTVTRAVLAKRHLSHGGIAGVVVGVVFAVLLAALCLYPVVVKQLRKRRRRRHAPDLDPETAEANNAAVPCAADDAHRRLSSQDSFKPGEVSRGVIGNDSAKDMPWASHGGNDYSQTTRQPLPGSTYPLDTTTSTTAASNYQPDSANLDHQNGSFPDYSGEFMPQAIGDNHNGILNGTSADYYSPSVPSEAFGMVTAPEPVPEQKRSLSRGSSLRQNVMQLFRRKSTRDQSSPSSPAYSETQEVPVATAPGAQDVALRHITTSETVESPINMAPSGASMPPPPVPRVLGSPVQLGTPSPPQQVARTPPESPPTENKFKMSPSPPVYAAPGTVNPMDIMPASTDTELYHRTEHELYMAYHSSPPIPEAPQHEASPDAPSPFTLSQNSQPTPVVYSPTPTEIEHPSKEEPADVDIPMTDIPSNGSSNIPSNNHLSPLPDNHDLRHPSYPSDSSTPQPGPASTNPSTQNTPATQLDSPSPRSDNTSDYRHSASPNMGFPNLSPRATNNYACDEPGCNQVFDQPHKLKHHQRYHTKDHKCTYPGCDKGFGTKTHLQRHINDRHEKKKKFHCSVPGCDYSKQGGKGFPRKDNWKRHMIKIHGKQQHELPEPVEADHEMMDQWIPQPVMSQ